MRTGEQFNARGMNPAAWPRRMLATATFGGYFGSFATRFSARERAAEMKKLPGIVVVLLLCLLSSAHADEAKPVVLFNGKDLSGWKHAGPEEFEVADGELPN